MAPSRDSQDERHCESARQARSGWPRWSSDASRPSVISPRAMANAARPNPEVCRDQSGGRGHTEQEQEAVAGARSRGEAR